MRVFVTGAGASKDAGYPLGAELLDEIDSYVRGSGNCFDRFDYSEDWPDICKWLETNENLLVREAYGTRNIESLFTALDFTEQMRQERLDSVARHAIKGNEKAASEAEASWKALDRLTTRYADARRVLLWGLEQFLEYKHQNDQLTFDKNEWDYLRSFGRKLCGGDFLITFNYDSTMERVLYPQKKWFPSDGYGFDVVFQKSRSDEKRIVFPPSPVKIFHLHGAIGWYRKPAIRDASLLPPGGGAIPREALTPAPLETKIGLDPIFLGSLGVPAVDASLPTRPSDERQIFIHPSFFKNYQWEGGQNTVFVELWKTAGDVLRTADEVFIIGYSLPEADSAALTLLLTSCSRKKIRVVNSNKAVNVRLNRLLGQTVWRQEVSFKKWLDEIPDCTD